MTPRISRMPRPAVSSTEVSRPVRASMNFDSELKLPITRTASELSRIGRSVSVVRFGPMLRNDTFASTQPSATRLHDASM